MLKKYKISLRIPDPNAIGSVDPGPRQAGTVKKNVKFLKIKNFMFEQFSGGLGGFFKIKALEKHKWRFAITTNIFFQL
jgi:hypothetical protein